jgi:molybdopterin synthase sulfur carrier subunit
MITLNLPTQLQKFADNQSQVTVNGATVTEILNNLCSLYHGVKERLFNAEGKINRFVLVFVNDEDIRFLQNETTPLKSGDVVTLVPAIAGG